MARRRGRLYRGRGTPARERRMFERRYEARGYSKARADRIYGAVVGKVKRERAAKRIVHAHRHYRGDHRGRCSTSCRAGRIAHFHPRGRRRRNR